MNISILQPKIIRGNTKNNVSVIQKLIDNASGTLMVLAEYALTGSLVLEDNVDIEEWVTDSEKAISKLHIPDGKRLLLNSLVKNDGKVYNSCSILPGNITLQEKTNLDELESKAGISSGNSVSLVQIEDKNISIIICSDLKVINEISTDGADLILFIFHFTPDNLKNRVGDLARLSKERGLPIIAASLVSDRNNGHSCYINGSTIISIGDHEGILEVMI